MLFFSVLVSPAPILSVTTPKKVLLQAFFCFVLVFLFLKKMKEKK